MRYFVFLLCLSVATPVWAGASRSFDGATDECTLGNQFNYSGTQAFTVSAWISYDTITDPDQDAILLRFTPGTAGSWGMRLDGTGADTAVMLCYREVTPFNVPGATTLSPSVWYYLACAYDSTNMRAYLNGVLDGGPTAMGSVASTSIDDRIGGNNSTTMNFDGTIADVRVWNRALTQIEIQEEMLSPGRIPGSQQLWSPLFGTASPEQDLSGSGRTCTLTGTSESLNGPAISIGVDLPL